MEKKLLIKRIARNAIVMALYVGLTYISYPIAYGSFQFRISELLVLLCFFNKDYIFAITLGCFFANIGSTLGPWDMLIGTSATFLACLSISFCKHLAVASLLSITINSFIIGSEIYWLLKQPFWLSVGEVALGETVVIISSYIICMIIMKKESIQKIINANKNIDFKW